LNHSIRISDVKVMELFVLWAINMSFQENNLEDSFFNSIFTIKKSKKFHIV